MILSVVVPIYNVEAYLKKCVKSLLDQNLSPEDYEILLIDDGATDSSGAICDEFAALYSNIHVIHQKNGGLSAARNTGIAAAKGKYIQFVDSDDYLNTNVLQGIVRQMEDNALDILRFNYQNVNAAGRVFEPNRYSKPFVDYSENVCDGVSFLNERLGFGCYAWQFVILTSLLQQEGNTFKTGIYFEDVEWTPRILIQARRVASTSMIAYNYLYRTDSIARNSDSAKKEKAIRDRINTLSRLNALKTQVGDNRWFKGMISRMSLSVINDLSVYFYEDRKKYFSELKHLGIFPLSTYHATKSAKRKILLANLSPNLLGYLLHANQK